MWLVATLQDSTVLGPTKQGCSMFLGLLAIKCLYVRQNLLCELLSWPYWEVKMCKRRPIVPIYCHCWLIISSLEV